MDKNSLLTISKILLTIGLGLIVFVIIGFLAFSQYADYSNGLIMLGNGMLLCLLYFLINGLMLFNTKNWLGKIAYVAYVAICFCVLLIPAVGCITQGLSSK